jgi:hypothetical protein
MRSKASALTTLPCQAPNCRRTQHTCRPPKLPLDPPLLEEDHGCYVPMQQRFRSGGGLVLHAGRDLDCMRGNGQKNASSRCTGTHPCLPSVTRWVETLYLEQEMVGVSRTAGRTEAHQWRTGVWAGIGHQGWLHPILETVASWAWVVVAAAPSVSCGAAYTKDSTSDSPPEGTRWMWC